MTDGTAVVDVVLTPREAWGRWCGANFVVVHRRQSGSAGWRHDRRARPHPRTGAPHRRRRPGPGPAPPSARHRHHGAPAAGDRPHRAAPDRLGQRARPGPPAPAVRPARRLRRRAAGPGHGPGAAAAGGVLGARGLLRPAADLPGSSAGGWIATAAAITGAASSPTTPAWSRRCATSSPRPARSPPGRCTPPWATRGAKEHWGGTGRRPSTPWSTCSRWARSPRRTAPASSSAPTT